MTSTGPSALALAIARTVDGDRLWRRHMEMAAHGATPNGGVSRLALSPEEAAARSALVAIARDRGLGASSDPLGNLFIRLEGTEPDLPPVLSGSHVDSQPTGGRFDGIYGVLAALEVLETLVDQGIQPRRSIDVVAWMNEEGARFAPGMMGSEGFAGIRKPEEILAVRDGEGLSVAEALLDMMGRTPTLPLRPLGFPLAAYVEAHIEQGSALEVASTPIGVVTGIQGKYTYRVEVAGREGHAGTQTMNQRQDALLAALRVVARLNALCLDAGPEVFFTVGRFEVHPNAPSVVPGRATFSMDLRHRDGAVLEALDARFDAVIGEVVPPCVAKITRLVRAAPNGFDHGIRRLAHGVAAALGLAAMDVLSAAGHDARHMAPLAPSAMVFVPSKDGLSHHEAEWTEPEHLTAGTRVLAALLLDLAGVGRQNDHGK